MKFFVVQPYLSWIVNTPLVVMLCGGIVGYLFIAALFAVLYAIIPCGVINSGVVDASSKCLSLRGYEYFAFSVITQSTLGYGNLVPYGLISYVIAIVHLIIGMTFYALFAGFLVVRALVPAPNSIVASPYLAFDPDAGNFSVRLMNNLGITIFDITVKMLSIRLVTGTGVFNRRPIKMLVEGLSYLDSRIPTILRTERVSAKPIKEIKGDFSSFLTPDSLGPVVCATGRNYSDIREIRLIISGHTAIGQVSRVVKFERENIICGKHKITYTEETDTYDLDKFEEAIWTDEEVKCSTCEWDKRCSLQQRKRQ